MANRRTYETATPAIAVVGHARDPQIVRIDVRLLEDEEIMEISRRLHETLG